MKFWSWWKTKNYILMNVVFCFSEVPSRFEPLYLVLQTNA